LKKDGRRRTEDGRRKTNDERRTTNNNGYVSGVWFGCEWRIGRKWVRAAERGEDVAEDGWMEAAHFQFGLALRAEDGGARRVLVHTQGNPAFAFGA
jgi:hypothetical protein